MQIKMNLNIKHLNLNIGTLLKAEFCNVVHIHFTIKRKIYVVDTEK